MRENNRLRALMHSLPDGIDAALITSDVSRLYYTRLKSSAGVLLVLREHAYFIIDFRYIEAAREHICGCEVLLMENLHQQLTERLSAHGAKRIAVESDYMTLSALSRYREALGSFELVTDSELSRIIREQRAVKSPEELDCIRQAQKITDDSFTYILGYIRAGRTEREVALELEFYSRCIGSQEASFEFIAVSGANGSRPHGVPTDKPLRAGEMLTLDFGAVIDGYHSDMTRTVGIAHLDEEQRKVYETVYQAGVEAEKAVRGGVKGSDIDAVARGLIDAAGYKGCFGHSLGHGVGLEIHEEPRFAATSQEICPAGSIITIEPGIYIEGRFGCRIEDMVYLTDEGCVNLTASSKVLFIL